MWNGVGGKIEDNETPYEGVIRETFEETGIQLHSVTYKGNVIFKDKDELEDSDGMYVFLADLPDEVHIETPLNTDEGILEWKSINWILDEDNRGVISNLKRYLPRVLQDEKKLEHTFIYDHHNIIDYTASNLGEDDMKKRYVQPLVSQ